MCFYYYYYLNEQSPCESFPCKNGGTCRPLYETDRYICICRGLWVGKNCDMSEYYCSSLQFSIVSFSQNIKLQLSLGALEGYFVDLLEPLSSTNVCSFPRKFFHHELPI